jgi:hypothetical protein
MQILDHDQRTAVIPAPPDVVWAVVSDVTRTPELSPEISSCRWLDGHTGPAVGARFEATNTVNGKSWKNRPVVTAAEPGRVFAFARTERFAGTVSWRYELEPVDGGTRVTESYEVVRPLRRVGWFVIERVYGCRDRRGDLARGMEQTLQRLGELVAQDAAADRPAGRPAS